TQERAVLGYLATTRYPGRDRLLFLLSMKAGLRAKAMASLIWAMVTDAAGQVAEVLHVPNRASKGKTGGRTIPLHPDLQAALVMLQLERACSGREGLNLTGASPVVPIARFRHVAIPQFVVGNHTFFAWCTRPGC